MKLIVSIVQNEDANSVLESLKNSGFFVTRLATKGGFLGSGNTTLITGVENEKVSEVIKIIEEEGKARMQVAPAGPSFFMESLGTPIEVKVGGATIFVLDVEQFVKV
ncbi:MAG: cyclic-di-AMP receptor [Defluviitaleaceae bacterium]|nr:cyclic-di-AMP receptor [Defluviitaleaceae bacterium]